MQKIEKMKRECGARAIPGGRKPMHMKELSATTTGPPLFTDRAKMVGDLNRVDTGGVKEDGVGWLRGESTLIIKVVAKLIGCT